MSGIGPVDDVASFGTAIIAVRPRPAFRAVVRGEVDMANADLVGRFIAEHCQGHVDRLDVDLAETSYIDSAGIAMLLRLADRLDTMRVPLVVIAPPGSAAHRVIELTGLSNRLNRVDVPPPPRATLDP